MVEKMSTNSLQALSEALGRLESTMAAEECHGTLIGMLCGHGEVSQAQWYSFIAPGGDAADLLQKEALGRLEALRQEALADEGVQRVQKFFPEGRIESVQLPGTLDDEGQDVR